MTVTKQAEAAKATPVASKPVVTKPMSKRQSEKLLKEQRRRTDLDTMEVDGKTTKTGVLQQQTIQQTLQTASNTASKTNNDSVNTPTNSNDINEEGNSTKNDVSMDSAASSKSGRQRKKKSGQNQKELLDESSIIPKEFSCLIIDNDTDFNDAQVQNDLQDAIIGSTHFLNMIQGSSIYKMAGNHQFIHALCLVTNTPIHYKRCVENHALVEMLRDALYMISHDSLELPRIRSWKFGIDVVRELSTCRKNASLTKMIESIKDGYFKNAHKIVDWDIFARTLGILLPPGSFKPEYKQEVLDKALAQLNIISIEETSIDIFSYAILANYCGLELATNTSLPGVLTDKSIPAYKRVELFPEFGLSLPEDCKQNKEFGTEAWCSAKQQCKIDLCCATSKCNKCGLATHVDCGTLLKEGIICSICKSVNRSIWLPQGKTFDIPLPTNSVQLTNDAHISSTAKTGNNDNQASNSAANGTTPQAKSTAATITPTATGTAKATPSTVGNSSTGKNSSTTITVSPTTPNDGKPAAKIDETGKKLGFDDQVVVSTFENIRPVNEITTRVTIKLKMTKVTEEEDELEVLIKILAIILERLVHVDKSVKCIQWKSNAATTTLDYKSMPQSLETLQEFMPRLWPRPGTFMYTNARLSHERSWDAINSEVSPWLRFRSYSLWPNSLQVESTINVGWFLYSAESYNTKSIAEALKTHFGIDVELRWQIIRLDRTEDLGPTPIKAIAALSPTETEKETRNALDEIYNYTTVYPLSISMKFIKKKEDQSFNVQNQIKASRTQQGIFLTSISSHSVNTITDLNWKPARIEGEPPIPNLRTIIMGMKSSKKKRTMFLGVTVHNKTANMTTFTFKNRYHKSAPEFARTIAGYMYHIYKERSMGFFTAEAALAAAQMVWDPVKRFFLTQDDRDMERLMRMMQKNIDNEKAKDAEAMELGEFSDAKFKEQQAAMENLALCPVFHALDTEEQDVWSVASSAEKTETTIQRHCINVMDGFSVNDIGSITSGKTRESCKFGYTGDCDRSSVQDSMSQTRKSHRNDTKALGNQERLLIENIEFLEKREKELHDINQLYLADEKTRNEFEAYCKEKNITFGKPIAAPASEQPASTTTTTTEKPTTEEARESAKSTDVSGMVE